MQEPETSSTGDATNAKQQIVAQINKATNILVTVSNNPSVDALSAALGLSLLLNKMDKHATAVFSGAVPPAINFLKPEKRFENKVDSLRDFIIALDKEKADRLRYKVEDEVVKIFITPYRTTITEKDLQFSQGDFHVDLIIALGVEKQSELDGAIAAHGRILHDATVVTINAAAQKSSLGTEDWQDSKASSLSEMLVGLADTLQSNLLDAQISTALLTGLVAATDRFSNDHTTPEVMTLAAKLMAAGADQQLIANNLRNAAPVAGNAGVKLEELAPKTAEAKANGEMQVHHDAESTGAQPLPPLPAQAPVPELALPIVPPPAQAFNDLKKALNEEIIKQPGVPMPEKATPGSASVNAGPPPAPPKPEVEDSYLNEKPSWMGRNLEPPTPPSMGGTLNATAEQALTEKMTAEADKRNHKILTHGAPAETAPAGKPNTPAEIKTPPMVSDPQTAPAPAPVSTSQGLMDNVSLQTEPTIEQLEKEARDHAHRNDSVAPPAMPVIQSMPLAPPPVSPSIAPPLPVPLSAVPPLPAPAPPTPLNIVSMPGSPAPMPLPAQPPLPPLPPMPDFGAMPPGPMPNPMAPSLPPLPPLPGPAPIAPPPPPVSSDPSQFKIPGMQ